MTDKTEIINIIDRPWSYNDIEYWINPKDKCCNAVILFNEKRSRLRAGVLIVKDDEILLGEEEDQPGVFSIPGGGLEKDETPVDAAKREAQEEVFITVKNARDTEYDYCECNTAIKKWVKDNVPEKKWWYNYYTCLIIAEYDGDYMGKVDKVDLDKSMKASSKWYKIKDVIDKPGFKKQWKKALINFGYYTAAPITESIHIKEDTNSYMDAFKEQNINYTKDGSTFNFASYRDTLKAIQILFDRHVAFTQDKTKIIIKDHLNEAAFMTKQPVENLIDRAKQEFGLTKQPYAVGYILPDGSLLDLGDEHNSRGDDHRIIGAVYDDTADTQTDYMINFMSYVGAIRVIPELPGFDIIKEPTEAQYEQISNLSDYYRSDIVIEIDNALGETITDWTYNRTVYGRMIAEDIKYYFASGERPESEYLSEAYKTIYETIWVYVYNKYDGGGWDQEIDLKDGNITKTINDYRRSLGWNMYGVDYLGPGKTHSAKDEKKGYTQLNLFDFNEHLNTGLLLEDSRTTLLAKSRNAGNYTGDTSRGKNRFERKKYSKVANYVKQYNNIDMNDFFKKDILLVKVPVTGETKEYLVSIKVEGVCAEIARNIKSNNNKLEFRTIIQALTKIFNTGNVYVNCTCDDYKYRFAHWNIVNNVSTDDTAHDPGPGKGIRNPNDDKGRGCKHILLVLNNGDWMLKVASVINNYIHYAEEHLQKPFLNIIFPKLYGVAADEMILQGLVDDDKYLDSSTGLIDAINEYGKTRGRYKAGTNKNPVTGTGGRTKKQAEEPQTENK